MSALKDARELLVSSQNQVLAMKDRYRHRRRASFQAWDHGMVRTVTYYVGGEELGKERVRFPPRDRPLSIPLLPSPGPVTERLLTTEWEHVVADYHDSYQGRTLVWWQKIQEPSQSILLASVTGWRPEKGPLDISRMIPPRRYAYTPDRLPWE
jgi:hypothetical protein